MRMCSTVRRSRFLAIVGVWAVVVALSGCPAENEPTKPAESSVKKQPAAEFQDEEPVGGRKAEGRAAQQPSTTNKDKSAAQQVAQDVEEAAKKPHDLGAPLV